MRKSQIWLRPDFQGPTDLSVPYMIEARAAAGGYEEKIVIVTQNAGYDPETGAPYFEQIRTILTIEQAEEFAALLTSAMDHIAPKEES